MRQMPKKRIVIKVGSYVLSEKEGIAKERMLELVKLIVTLKRADFEVILVSSGAISAGYTKLKLDKSDTINRQVLASIGQPYLLSIYQEFFDSFNMLSSQVLLPSEAYISNAKNTITRLLEQDIIPIINENDTVSIDELSRGDNDMLSAFVTHFFNADMLVILSNISTYSRDNKAIKKLDTIPKVEINNPIYSKLEAGKFILSHNKEMFLASGFDLFDVKSFLLEGVHKGGTVFKA
ncbi:Glutamate 5-kinase [hydrothermal vent metagenome]|uniref:Glutamate 5-kinase n=1 Tax=hydrothermal vent metagenome TaxID=652676 RepID=A0A1W1CZW2_9ZZZZ